MSPQAPARRVPGSPRRGSSGRAAGPPAEPLAELLHYRWAVPVLGAFHDAGGGTRVAVLQRGLGVSRESLTRTLAFLTERGLVERNPGYGHPLRPELRLTPAGKPLAAWSARLHAHLVRLGVEDAALRKWPLAVARALGGGARRFNELRAELPGLTARALTQALEQLESAGIARRRVEASRPPRTVYRLERRGRGLLPVLRALPTAALEGRRRRGAAPQ